MQSKMNDLRGQLTNVITVLNRRFSELESNNKKELEQFEGVLERKFNVTKQSLNEAVSALKTINPEDIAKPVPQKTISAAHEKPAAEKQAPAPPDELPHGPEQAPSLQIKNPDERAKRAAGPKKKIQRLPDKTNKKSSAQEIREAARYLAELKRRNKNK
jgi:hypothetical protein